MRKRILVVDDNATNLRLFELLLRGEYAVETASDAGEALSAVNRHRPDLILMDVRLPDMDGLALTRVLRADHSLRTTPIVALTAHATIDDRDRALAAGCDGFVTKPVDTQALRATIELHLGTAS